jgi:Zn-dependent protease with chaperone function
MALETNIRPAALAAERMARAVLALGALGLAAAAFVVVRLFESWRVGPSADSHRITIFGLRLTYPVANVDAIVVVALACVGLAVLLSAARGCARELRAARRFTQRLAACITGAVGDALVIDGERPDAFCAGLFQPRVYISTGALELLDDRAVAAVIEHERHHAQRRDPLRLAAGRVVRQAVFFVPGLRRIVDRAASLAELSADEHAVEVAPESRPALARAMLAFDHRAGGIDPMRVDSLTGRSGDWRFPTGLCVLALATVALIGAVAFLAGRVASGSTTLALPLLSRQPCVVVLAAIPAVLAVVAVRFARGR